MSTIRERAQEHVNETKRVPSSVDSLVEFAQAERALQRQECAEAVRLWLTDDVAAV